jgi:hypothetical protein
MGPQSGASEVIIQRTSSSPYLAAMANAAASHMAEQDDVHNGSVFHPATVVFPAALAVAQAIGASGQQLLTAAVAGYEVGIRVGEFLGRSHYKVFHTRARPVRWPRQLPWVICSDWTHGRCSTPSALREPSRLGCGSSCARRRTASSCTPRTQLRQA